MIHIFNRKELCVTFDLKSKQEIIEKLASNNIEYTYHTQDARSSGRGSRARAVNVQGNVQFYNKCTFYVLKKDYEKAKYLIGIM